MACKSGDRDADMAGPSPEYLKTPSLAVAPAFSADRGESHEAYAGVVARLNDRLRVIDGQCGLQWILQGRKSPTRWESIAFCATKEGLLLRIKEHLQHLRNRNERLPLETLASLYCDPVAWEIVRALPDYYSKGNQDAAVPVFAPNAADD